MKSIKFSHTYPKLLDSHNSLIEHATLLDVVVTDLAERSKPFLDYDTDNGKYPLPKNSKYLMLIFIKPYDNYLINQNLFTTLRRFTEQKYQYYKSLIGEDFKIDLTQKEEKE